MREVDWQIRSNRPLLYICTHEEERVWAALERICDRKAKGGQWTMYGWDITGQLVCNNPKASLPQNGEAADQLSVLSWFDGLSDGLDDSADDNYTILVLKDYQKFFEHGQISDQIEKQVVRQIRNMCQKYKYKHKCIIVMGISLNLPPELQKMATIIDWPLPEKEHISEEVDKMLETIKKRPELSEFQTQYTADEQDEIVSSLQGLTLTEIELLNSYIVLTRDKLSPVFMASRKREIIRESGLLDWRDSTVDIDSVGGMSEFKKWLKKRKNAFGNDAKEYGLPESIKGVLAVGVQGCGKSRLAEALADYYKLPLLRLDVGSLFSGTLGSTEENIRMAIKVAESIAPCILWCDELEKGFSGSGSSNYTDGGTSSRVFATFLTWMQMKTKPVILFATANDISSLPPELIRKGRFDEIFFVDLPLPEERAEIFTIHLELRERDVTMFDMDSLVQSSDGFTGAEIEAAIVDAMYVGFDEGKRQINTQDIVTSLRETVPLSVQMKEQVDALRVWARSRARHASVPRKSTTIQSEIARIKQAPRNTVAAHEQAIEEDEQL
jgi:AAA+ superfamily predicted ATPase